jgi:ADP-heptose:LPS heptosyltransferase
MSGPSSSATNRNLQAFGYKMDFYHPKDLLEHFQIINSCKFFIGNQSAPLAMAHSMDVARLAILSKSDEIHYIGEEKFSRNFFYIAEDKMFYEGIDF